VLVDVPRERTRRGGPLVVSFRLSRLMSMIASCRASREVGERMEVAKCREAVENFAKG